MKKASLAALSILAIILPALTPSTTFALGGYCEDAIRYNLPGAEECQAEQQQRQQSKTYRQPQVQKQGSYNATPETYPQTQVYIYQDNSIQQVYSPDVYEYENQRPVFVDFADYRNHNQRYAEDTEITIDNQIYKYIVPASIPVQTTSRFFWPWQKPHAYSTAESTTPDTFIRLVKDCSTNAVTERQVIDSSSGYWNYVGGSRYQEQCLEDNSFDTYYVETPMPY